MVINAPIFLSPYFIKRDEISLENIVIIIELNREMKITQDKPLAILLKTMVITKV